MWRERLRFARPFLWALLLILTVSGIAFFGPVDPFEKGERLSAIIVNFVKPQSEVWRPMFLMVELDSGEVVKLGGSAELRFEKGRRVIVQAYVSPILGRRRYSFVAYEDAAANDGNQP